MHMTVDSTSCKAGRVVAVRSSKRRLLGGGVPGAGLLCFAWRVKRIKGHILGWEVFPGQRGKRHDELIR